MKSGGQHYYNTYPAPTLFPYSNRFEPSGAHHRKKTWSEKCQSRKRCSKLLDFFGTPCGRARDISKVRCEVSLFHFLEYARDTSKVRCELSLFHFLEHVPGQAEQESSKQEKNCKKNKKNKKFERHRPPSWTRSLNAEIGGPQKNRSFSTKCSTPRKSYGVGARVLCGFGVLCSTCKGNKSTQVTLAASPHELSSVRLLF